MDSAAQRTQPPIKFGADCELDPASYELRRSGRVLKLERIPAEILLFLVERRGQLVTRDEIAERIWGRDVFLDTDNSINGAIRKIRQALKDDPERPRFIQTITGRGYRFIAPNSEPKADAAALLMLQSAASAQSAAAASAPPPPVDQANARKSKSSTSLWLGFVALAVALIAVAAVWFFRTRSSAALPRNPARVVLAVLPFQNLTGDPSQDYFSDGMTEEMITEIGTLNPDRLGVIARTSVMTYQHNPKPVAEVGRELGAQYVLEGSLRREGDKVRITAQLIRAQDQTHLWAKEYDRDLKDLLILQSDIASDTSNHIAAALGEPNQSPSNEATFLSPEQSESHDLYLKGLYFWNKRTAADLERAIDYFQRAVDQDPQNARAYAGLADSYALLGGYGAERPQYAVKAKAAALRALLIAPNLAETHTAYALITENYEWQWKTAEEEYQRALALNPSYATAHQWYAECLMWQGRFDEALKESDRARQLDPLSLIIAADRGVIFYYARQYDRAIQELLRVREMDPSFPRASMIVEAYEHKGMLVQASSILGPPVDAPWSWADYAAFYARAGRRADAQHALDRLLQLEKYVPVNVWHLVEAYLATGNKEQALACLEWAYKEEPNALTSLKVDPLYDPLRNDPRFQTLLQRIGLDR